MANFTEDGNATSKLNQRSMLSADTGVFLLFLFALNIFLALTAFLGNALILIAFRKVSSLHRHSKRLFGCLAVTDLCVGLISQPLIAIILLGFVTEINWNIYSFALKVCRASSYTLCGVSILTSTAISVDRLLTLLLGLRYRHFVTLRRVRAVISCFWLIAVSAGMFMYLLFGYSIVFTVAISLAVLSIVISLYSYTKILLTLRQQQAEVQAHVQGQPMRANGGGIPLNIARYKRTVSSIAWVHLALVACYVPFVFPAVMIMLIGLSDTTTATAFLSTSTLVYLNSSLNPLLYCWKIGEVRQAVKATIRQFFCCLRKVISGSIGDFRKSASS